MADERPDAPDGEQPPRTPFDNPFFLPVMLWIFTLWFGWDAWIVPMEEHLAFNRYSFPIVLVLAIWTSIRAVRERRQEREREAARSSGASTR